MQLKSAILFLAALIGIYLTSLYGYLLFHGLAEVFSIVIACGIFMIVWNVRRFLQSQYLLFIGIAYLFVGGIDLLHTFAFKRMGVFEGHGANLPTQLWIVARYTEAFSLLLATLFFHRKLNPGWTFLGYGTATGLLLATIFYWKVFPDCFIEGMGLTPFKITSEYIICLILLVSAGILLRHSKEFDRGVLVLLFASILTAIVQELTFTTYLSVYGFSNLVGHLLKIASFYFLYKAIVETSLVSPYDLLFRKLKQSEEQLRLFVEQAPASLAMFDRRMRFLSASRRWSSDYGLEGRNLIGLSHYEVLPEIPDHWKELHARALSGEVVRAEDDRFDRADGSVRRLRREMRPWHDERGNIGGILIFSEDVTQRVEAEDTLREAEQRVRVRLESIISPEGNLGSLELSDIIDTEAVQLLMASFYELTHFPVSIIDLKGKLLVGVGWQDICVKFHRVRPETCKHCIESDTLLSAGIPKDEFRLYRCKNNMWDIASPVFVGGKHLGNLFSGQFFFDDESLDYDLFKAQARQYGFSEDEYISALEKVPRLSRKSVEAGIDFLLKLAHVLSQLSHSNLKLARSLSERDALMEKLRESQERYRIMGEILPYGVWWCDGEGKTQYVSPSFCELLNMPLEEQKGFGWTHRLVPEDVEPMMQKWMSCVQTVTPWDHEHRIIDRNGKIHTILSRGLPVRDKEGKVTSWAGINLDITERKQMEEELRKSRDELELRVRERTAKLSLTNRALREYAEKLERLNEELKEFAWVASHDLQEPLRKIMTFGDRLSHLKDSLGERGWDDLDRMIKSVRRMASLVSSLASYAGMTREIVASQLIDLKAVVKEVVSDLEFSISEVGGYVEIGELPTIGADTAKIRQLFQNLISNAIKYTGEQEKPRVKVTGKIVGNVCRIEVEDNGIGFEEQYLDRIFKPFQRLHGRSSRFEGTGMGLTICRKVVELHGGTITARSKPGEGSTFIVHLPVNQGAHQRDTI